MKACILDGKMITDKKKLHETLQTELEFPTWYGANLDALYDSLTDMHEEVNITVINSSDLELNLGGYAKVFYKVLDSACENNNFIGWKKEN
jgi:ribonuclease inhibitor